MDYIEKLELQTEELKEVENLENHSIINDTFSVNKYNGHTREFLPIGGEYNDGYKPVNETVTLGVSCNVSKEVRKARKDINGYVHDTLKDRIDTLQLNDKIDFSIYAEIPYPDGYTAQQGGCITDKYILLGLTNTDDSDSIIRVYNKDTLEFLNEFNGQFYHINSITFNNDDKEIIITHCIANGDDKNTISIIHEDELIKTSPTIYNKTLDNFSQVQSICFGNGYYYLNSTSNKKVIYVLNKNFNIVSNFETDNESILQNIEYYNNLLFITRINLPSGSISDELVQAFSSVIEVYTNDGNYIKSYIMPSKAEGNEIEAFFNYKDGTFLSAWKGYNATILMLSRVFENPYYEVTEITEDYAWQSSIMKIYVNKNHNGLLCNGSELKPFKSISQAMKHVYDNGNVNEVDVNIIGDFSNENIHLKNKHFKINCIENAKIKGVIGKNCSIRLNDVNIISNNIGLNVDGCNVMINGLCNISSTGNNTIHATNSKIYISGTSLTLVEKPMFLANTDMSINCNLILSNVNNVTLRGSNLRYTVSLANDLLDKIVMERGSTVFTSGYNNMNYSSIFTGYNNSYNTVRLTMNGNQVSLNGIMKPTSAIAGGTEKHLICTLPSNLKPLSEHNFVCHGSSTNTYMITIETNGNVNFSRYTNNSTYIEATSSAWLPYSITYTL